MATLNQALITPEVGWKRYDDTNVNFSYSGLWEENSYIGYFGSRAMRGKGVVGNLNFMKFYFKGTKIRIIGSSTSNTAFDNSVAIEIDGIKSNFTQIYSTATHQALLFEKINLADEYHEVKIYPQTVDKIYLFDAVDIDFNGVFGLPVNKTLISLNGTTRYYNAGWKTIASPPSKSDFETYGHDDLSLIKSEAWSELLLINPDVKLLTYVPTGNVANGIDVTVQGKGLGLSAIPVPQFVHLKNPAGIYGNLSDLMVSEGINNDVKNNTRYLISPNKTAWYTWDGTSFVSVDASVNSNILTKGMTYKTILNMQEPQWTSWSHDNLYVGVYLDDDIRGKSTSIVDKISYADLAPKYSTKVSDAKLYILNTTSTINVTFAGKTITGSVDDADSGKVQYRVLLNGNPYFPQSGDFTPLQAAPLDVALTLSNDEIKIDENNVLRIEFQDYWGATDYWQTNFVGTYNGLMFLDSTGKYYSTDVGEILQNLDFGIIIAGQTTVEQAIILRNTYGYPVNNILIRANQANFPVGMSARFGTNEISFESLDELLYAQTLEDGEELTFYIRLATQLGVTPPTSGEFDIIVTADKVI